MHVKETSILTAGRSPALPYARSALQPYLCDEPARATHLLLPVPSFDPEGNVKGGILPEQLLAGLSADITVIGGNLDHPSLINYKKLDLLQDPFYLAENAAITAHCALGLILPALPVVLSRQPALIIGWGRIGKCLADLLSKLGASVTIAARKESDCAMAEALGFHTVKTGFWNPKQFRLIVNTVPAPVLDRSDCADDAFLMDLASVRGITGEGVLWARGLPGKCAPESSGILIANTVLRLIGKE